MMYSLICLVVIFLLDELVACLFILTIYLLILGIGCLIADFVFPHIPFIERYLESLPDWDDEEDW